MKMVNKIYAFIAHNIETDLALDDFMGVSEYCVAMKFKPKHGLYGLSNACAVLCEQLNIKPRTRVVSNGAKTYRVMLFPVAVLEIIVS